VRDQSECVLHGWAEWIGSAQFLRKRRSLQRGHIEAGVTAREVLLLQPLDAVGRGGDVQAVANLQPALDAQALNRGDLRQADDLSDRAAILANILLNGK